MITTGSGYRPPDRESVSDEDPKEKVESRVQPLEQRPAEVRPEAEIRLIREADFSNGDRPKVDELREEPLVPEESPAVAS